MTRITSTMLSKNYLYSVSKNMVNIQTLQNQLSTGKEISKPSDDPYKASRIIRMYADIGANEQYNDNITDASNFLDVTDTSLTQMSNLLSRVRELLVASGNAAYGSEQLKSIQDEMNAKVDQLAQILNTNFDGKYVFGGTKVDSKPVTVVDGKIQYADDGGNQLTPIYESSDGKYTTSTIGNNKALTPADINDAANTAIKTDLENELKKLKDIDDAFTAGTSTVELTQEQKDRKTELESMLTGGAAIYKDVNGNYTTQTTGKTKEVDFRNIDLKKIKDELKTLDADNDGKIDDDTNLDNVARFNELVTMKNSVVFYNQISADMKLEISQGVIVNYNQTASEILEFKDPDNPNRTINVSDLFSDIINNLNSEDGKSKLTGENLADLDKVISNVLSKSSEVGALQNRMEAAKKQNESDNQNLTTILSNVEDIDFTEKMIDFSTLMTVYKASLQISANILPKTIMDYL